MGVGVEMEEGEAEKQNLGCEQLQRKGGKLCNKLIVGQSSVSLTSPDQSGRWQQQRGCLYFHGEENQISADNVIKLDVFP